jgi:leucyl/phenylalanyl-tRNA--protein transferase
MFASTTDASKVAFWHAVQFLQSRGFELIDCQLPSGHLSSLGAISIPRREFLDRVFRLTSVPTEPGSWAGAFQRHLQNCDT